MMTTRTIALGTCVAAVLAAIGCQDSTTAPTAAAPRAARAPGATVGGSFGLSRLAVDPRLTARMTDQYIAEAARRAIDPGDYVCSTTPSPVRAWYLTNAYEFIDNEPATFNLLYYDLRADLVPEYEALIFQTTATPQYFGYTGEYTKTLRKTERDVKRFWDISSAGIELIGFHGTMLQDTARVAATYRSEFFSGLPAEQAGQIASIVRNAVVQSRTLNGGNHPLFSFNAFSVAGDGEHYPDKILMGDGILEGYQATGFGDVAPQAIFAHEFGHQIQFQNGYYEDPIATSGSGAERTRYTELMADAYSAYYLTHKRGATFNRKRVEQFLQVFFQIGDCGFTSPGHHGTPNQRMAAARFGFDVADRAQKKGHILTSAQFHALFVAAYPRLVAPDRV